MPATTPPAEPAAVDVRGRAHTLRRDRRRAALAVQAAVFAAVMLLWWLVTRFGLVPPMYLPGPGAVWDAFVAANGCHPASAGSTRKVCGVQNYYLWEHLQASLQRIAVGLGLGTVVGVAVGFAMSSSRWVMIALSPYLNFLRALPPLGYIGLLIVWFGMGDTSKNWLLFLAAFPPVVLATIEGVRSVVDDHVRAARSLGASRSQVITSVIWPSALPSIIAGLRLASGFAWTTVVAAELNNGIPGIGALAYLSGTQLQVPLTIACIIVIGLVAVALDALIVALGRLLVPWRKWEGTPA